MIAVLVDVAPLPEEAPRPARPEEPEPEAVLAAALAEPPADDARLLVDVAAAPLAPAPLAGLAPPV